MDPTAWRDHFGDKAVAKAKKQGLECIKYIFCANKVVAKPPELISKSHRKIDSSLAQGFSKLLAELAEILKELFQFWLISNEIKSLMKVLKPLYQPF